MIDYNPTQSVWDPPRPVQMGMFLLIAVQIYYTKFFGSRCVFFIGYCTWPNDELLFEAMRPILSEQGCCSEAAGLVGRGPDMELMVVAHGMASGGSMFFRQIHGFDRIHHYFQSWNIRFLQILIMTTTMTITIIIIIIIIMIIHHP